MQERLSKQGAQGDEAATVEVATKILNVLDNYDRAFQSIEATTNEEVEIVDAYKNTYQTVTLLPYALRMQVNLIYPILLPRLEDDLLLFLL